jgi:hypothetical protein
MDIQQAAALARATDAPPELVSAAQEAVLDALARIGIRTEADLADAWAEDVAHKTGMHVEHVLWFQEAARETLSLQLETRVVLADGNPTASVWTRDGERQGVRVLTARGRERVADMLARITGNAVVVREGDATAVARVDGHVIEGLPIFRRRGDGSEARARVKEIRERAW